ncbi:redoxin family protein [soil metagenome]
MPGMDDLQQLPADLPEPVDDGAADHLPGRRLPPVPLASTDGGQVDLSELPGTTVVYCYPMTGRPDRELPGGWDEIPGARGCTPQSCSFRDHHEELGELGARVFGLSTQGTAYQQEASERLYLPFNLLSDEDLGLTTGIGLPTFEVEGAMLTKRLTMIVDDGRISKVFYPVFPPNENAEKVVEWLSARATN